MRSVIPPKKNTMRNGLVLLTSIMIRVRITHIEEFSQFIMMVRVIDFDGRKEHETKIVPIRPLTYDLFIADGCNANNNSYADFPYSYNREGSSKIEKSQQSYTDFCGAPSGHNFRVLEYEVFRVLFARKSYASI
jgi:hypothetical protein